MWEQLQNLEKKIDGLRDRVKKAVEPEPASAREMLTLITQEITCVEDSTDVRSALFYNGSPDTYIISRFSVVVSAQTPGSANRTLLRPTPWGYRRLVSPGVPLAIGPFSFEWNYLVSSRQSLYSRQFVGPHVLYAGITASQAFDLYEPLILKPVDSVEFRLRPLCYALPGTLGKLAGMTYFVDFLAFGYRRPL